MVKPPKFVHVRLRDGRELIVHTATPAFVAQLHRVPAEASDLRELQARYDYGTLTHAHNGIRIVAGVVYWIDPVPERIEGLMSRLGDWAFFKILKNGEI